MGRMWREVAPPPVAHLARSMQESFRVADELKYSLAAASTRSTLLS